MRGFGATAGDPESVAASITGWSGRGIDVVVAMDGSTAAKRVAGLLAEAGAGLPVVDVLDRVESAVLPERHPQRLRLSRASGRRCRRT